uniref:C2H2-type domain-containing protein n=1 Tax=Parascaris univalens TaxID=6257 RepID=A0A915AJC3_PARUN
MSEPTDIIDIARTPPPPEPNFEQIFSDVLYDACDTPVSHDANPATMGAIVETERKIYQQIKLLLTQIKGLRDDELKEMLDKFVAIYRNSFERCVFLPEPEECEEVDPHATLRHHLSLRLDQWNEWFADKGVDRTLGRRFKDPNSKNKARMEGEEAIGLEEMKHRIQQIEQERLFEAELQKYQADQEKLDPHPAINNAEAKRIEKEKKSEARRCARAERAKEKKRQKDVEFLKTITLESAVGYVEPSVLEIYKAKCHLCEDRLTDPKYMIIHEKIRHPMMFFCHYCDRTFAAHGPMRVHCETVHLGLPVDPPGRRPPERANCTKGPSAHHQQPQPQNQQQKEQRKDQQWSTRAVNMNSNAVNTSEVAIDGPNEVEVNKEPTISVSLDAAPTLPVQRAASAQSKTSRRSRGNSKKCSTGASTATMPVLDAEDRFELGSCINLENSVSPEATPKKRPVAVVAPMTKHESLENSDQRPGPSGINRRPRSSNRSRASNHSAPSDRNEVSLSLRSVFESETRELSPSFGDQMRKETVHKPPLHNKYGDDATTRSQRLQDEKKCSAKSPSQKVLECVREKMQRGWRNKKLEGTTPEHNYTRQGEQAVSMTTLLDERAPKKEAMKAESYEEGGRTYPRKTMQRTCSLPPYSIEGSVLPKRWFSESDISLPTPATQIVTSIDEVLQQYGFDSSSSSSSLSDDSSLSDYSELDSSSSSCSESDESDGYSDRLVKYIVSQPGAAAAMRAFIEREQIRMKKRSALTEEKTKIDARLSASPSSTAAAVRSPAVGLRCQRTLDLSKDMRFSDYSVSSYPGVRTSAPLPSSARQKHQSPAVAPRMQGGLARTRPVILKGKARATELLAKMKAAVVSQQGDVPDEDSHESTSASDEDGTNAVNGRGVRGRPVESGASRASELLARMKKAVQERAAENPSVSDEGDDEVTSVRNNYSGNRGVSRASELLARMKEAAESRATENVANSSDSDEGELMTTKPRSAKKASSKSRGTHRANVTEKKRRVRTAKRTHPPSSDDASKGFEARHVTVPPTKKRRGRPRKATAS